MLPQTDANGRVHVAAAGTPVSWNQGIGYSANGAMCTTVALSGTDQYIGGWRLDAVGRVVVAAQSGSLFYNEGLPFNLADGSLACQIDVVPGVNDPYVSSIRVGPSGGVYFTTAAPS